MTAGRAYWVGVAVLFLTLLVAGLLPAVVGIPFIILSLWAGGQAVQGRWNDTPLARWLRGPDEPKGGVDPW